MSAYLMYYRHIGARYIRPLVYPYQLLFGKEMRMPFDQLVRYWKGKEEKDTSSVSGYIHTLRANIDLVREMAFEKEKGEKVKQKVQYNKKVREHAFDVGNFILVFRPTLKNKLLNQWQGPFPIAKRITPGTYSVDLATKIKRILTFHIKSMKEWKSPSAAVFMAEADEWEGLSEEREEKGRDISIPELQLRELEKFHGRYKDVLSDTPGRTNLVCNNIPTGDAPPVR